MKRTNELSRQVSFTAEHSALAMTHGCVLAVSDKLIPEMTTKIYALAAQRAGVVRDVFTTWYHKSVCGNDPSIWECTQSPVGIRQATQR